MKVLRNTLTLAIYYCCYYFYLQYCIKCEINASTEYGLLRLLLFRLFCCQPALNSMELSASSGRCHPQHPDSAPGREEGESEPVLRANGEAGRR